MSATIPIENLYYLLCYAWDVLEERELGAGAAIGVAVLAAVAAFMEVIDTIQVLRDTLAGLLNFHQSNMSKQLNATMKALTIIATIFLPPTFLVGVYGMNFHYMPELSWKWGYPVLWGIMVVIAGGMIWFFKRKRWF